MLGLTARDRVIASRFSCGLTPELAAEVLAAGGGTAWLDRQLALAGSTSDPGASVADWWPELHQTPAAMERTCIANRRQPSEVSKLVICREMVRRIHAPTQVHESLAEFWHHHLHVPAAGGAQSLWRAHYTDTVRSLALGRFEDLLQAAVVHPALLVYLDGGSSTKTRPNENLGRELLDLYTVGSGNYSEDDVKNCARVLTGYRQAIDEGWTASYRPQAHHVGPIKVLGFTDANGAADGRAVTKALVSYLAHHPATAERIARRLVLAFVSDDPPPALVRRLAATYLANDTAITPVLRELARSAELVASVDTKLRDPSQDVVATFRSLGVRITQPTSPTGTSSVTLALPRYVSAQGMPAMSWPTPDGSPLVASRWASPSRVLGAFKFHWTFATGTASVSDITYRSISEWVPQVPTTTAAVANRLSVRLLGLPTPPEVLAAICEIGSVGVGDSIGPGHPLITSKWGQVMGVYLDHPQRFRR